MAKIDSLKERLKIRRHVIFASALIPVAILHFSLHYPDWSKPIAVELLTVFLMSLLHCYYHYTRWQLMLYDLERL